MGVIPYAGSSPVIQTRVQRMVTANNYGLFRFDSYTPHYGGYISHSDSILSYGVIGNTSGFEPEESRFEPWWDNKG
jgi:hypothetical protein